MAIVRFTNGFLSRVSDPVSRILQAKNQAIIVEPRPGQDVDKMLREQPSAGIVVSFGGDE